MADLFPPADAPAPANDPPAPPPAASAPSIRPPGAAATLGLGCTVLIASGIAGALMVAVVLIGLTMGRGPAGEGRDPLDVLAGAPDTPWALTGRGFEAVEGLLILGTLLTAPVAVLMVLGYVRAYRLSPRSYLGLRRPTLRQALGWTAAVLAIRYAVWPLLERLGLDLADTTALGWYRASLSLPLLYLSVAVAAPVYEEVLFRGFLLEGLRRSRLGAAGAVALTAALWTACHLYKIPVLAVVFCEGLVLGMARLRTGSTYLTMGIHALVNLLVLVQVGYFLRHDGTEYFLEKGREHLKAERPIEAFADFQDAQRYARGPCPECQLGLAEVHLANGDPARAAGVARRLLQSRQEVPERDSGRLGLVLLRGAGRDRSTLEAAAELFRRELAEDRSGSNLARIRLAEALLRLGRSEEAAALARRVLAVRAGGKGEADEETTARILLCLSRPGRGLPDPFPAEGLAPNTSWPTPGPASSRGGGVERPRLIYREQPRYPESARRARIQGNLILESVIDQEGCVRDLEVLAHLTPDLDAAGIEAARRWVFLPATHQGRPVEVYYSLSVNFLLSEVGNTGQTSRR